MLEQPSVVVVGAGMLGTFVARALAAAGASVTCADVAPEPTYISRYGPAIEVPIVQVDMLDNAAVRSVLFDSAAAVIVIAAGLGRHASLAPCDGMGWRVNVVGPSVVLAAAARVGVRRVVFISSYAVYGNPGGGVPLPESAPTRPVSEYGRKKAAAERLLEESQPTTTQLAILRPCGVYGPVLPGREGSHAARLITVAIAQVLTTGRLRLRAPVGPFDECMYVKDLAEATALVALDSSSTDRTTFNVGVGRTLTGQHVCAALQDVFPTAHITLSSDSSDIATAKPALDTTAIERSLGFRPRYGLTDGIADLANEMCGERHAG